VLHSLKHGYSNIRYNCREIYCLEDTPASLHLSNINSNEYGDQNFLSFNFYFTKKLPEIRNHLPLIMTLR